MPVAGMQQIRGFDLAGRRLQPACRMYPPRDSIIAVCFGVLGWARVFVGDLHELLQAVFHTPRCKEQVKH